GKGDSKLPALQGALRAYLRRTVGRRPMESPLLTGPHCAEGRATAMRDFSSSQKRVLLVLTLINFVNWIDRQIVYPLFPLIKDDLHVGYAAARMASCRFQYRSCLRVDGPWSPC